MSTEAEDLLTEALSEGETSGPITLTVNEKTRQIEYEGELLLGVEDDDQSEKIYFTMPKLVGTNDLITATDSDVELFIIYKNAINETYKQQCTDITPDGDNVKFSWLLTRFVTAAKGKVSFMVCVQKLGTDTDGKHVILNEWHTTPFTGVVLVGIDTDHTTPEVLPTSTTASTAQLRAEVDALSQKIDDAIIGYSKTEIDAMFTEAESQVTELQRQLVATTDPLVVNSATNASKVNANYSTADNIFPLLFNANGTGTTGGNIPVGYNSNIYVRPSEGALCAPNIYEGSVKLSDKYMLKQPKSLQFKIYKVTGSNGTGTCVVNTNYSYQKYSFTYSENYFSQLKFATHIVFTAGDSVYRIPVGSVRYLETTDDTGAARTLVQVNASYQNANPAGTNVELPYYITITQQYVSGEGGGSTANLTVYRPSGYEMSFDNMSGNYLTIYYDENR